MVLSISQGKSSTRLWRLFTNGIHLLGVVVLLPLALSVQAIVTDDYDFKIPEGSLHSALLELGKQADSSIVFPSSLKDDQDISAIRGKYSVLQVLEQLIEGRNLEYRIIGPQTIVVLPRCRNARDCQSMREELDLSIQQYPMIEELIVRGRPVTGSRFKQINVNAFAPVDIITSAEIRLTGAQTISDLMRFTPAVAGNATSTAISNRGNGTANVTLRGLPGTNTLVLINGNRSVVNALDGSSVDLNSIPLAAVDHIEILKDSGSSIYGSDAIAGVVNVILKKSFDGVLVSSFIGQSSRSDNQTQRYDLVSGFDVGNLNLLLTASHYQQDGILSRDRSLSSNADGRNRGGVDRRTTATPTSRLLVDGVTRTLDSNSGGYLPGTLAADFREATDEDLFNPLSFTSSLTPTERDAIFINGQFKDLGVLDASFELSYVDNSTTITLAPTPIFTAFQTNPLTISAMNRFNPFGEDISDARISVLGLGPRLQQNEAETWRAMAMIMGNLYDGEWQLSVNLGQTDAEERLNNLIDKEVLALGLGDDAACMTTSGCVPINLFGSPGAIDAEQLNAIRASARTSGESGLASLKLDFSQRLNVLPAGDVEFASGLEVRRESLTVVADRKLEEGMLIGGEFGSSDGDRDTVEFYLESLLPLAKEAPGIHSLEADLSFRVTYSSDFSDKANPKLALRYRPIEDVMLRASFSTGFRAPSLFELFQVGSASNMLLSDPCTKVENVGVLPGCLTQSDPLRQEFLTVMGGNDQLRPETSKNISMGVVYTPEGLRDFRFGIDLFKINIDDVIGTNSQFILDQNAAGTLFPDQVVRNANGEIVQIIANNNNFGERDIFGFDVEVSWRVFIPKWGTFSVDLSSSHISEYLFQINPDSPVVDLAGTFVDEASGGNGSIPEWRSRLNLLWQFGRWEFAYSSFHVSSLTEEVPFVNRVRESGAWTRQDMQVNYHFNSGESLITFGIENLLDEMPPFMASAFNDNFDARTHELVGRFWYARISHRI